MAPDHLHALLDRFWSGEATPAEERTLAEAARRAAGPDAADWPETLRTELAGAADWMAWRGAERERALPDDFEERFWTAARAREGGGRIRRLALYWSARAAVLLLVALGAFALQRAGADRQRGEVLAYDAAGQEAEALQQATAALMLLSEKLDVGRREAARLGMLHTAMEETAGYATPGRLVRKAVDRPSAEGPR
jgi:hypothetical protein